MTASSSDHSAVFLPPVAIARRLERLSLAESAPRDVADIRTLDRAVETLTRAGLVARVVSTSPARLVGGRQKVERDGLVAHEDAFSLWREGDGTYYAGIAGRGNLGVRCGPCSLDEAVTFLQREYEKPANQRR